MGAKSSTEIFHLLMVNVLREFIAHCGANFVVALALKIVRGCKTAKIGHRFEIPDDDTCIHCRIQASVCL